MSQCRQHVKEMINLFPILAIYFDSIVRYVLFVSLSVSRTQGTAEKVASSPSKIEYECVCTMYITYFILISLFFFIWCFLNFLTVLNDATETDVYWAPGVVIE